MKLKNIFICILIFTLNIISYAESSIPKVEYKKIEVNSLEDIKNGKIQMNYMFLLKLILI